METNIPDSTSRQTSGEAQLPPQLDARVVSIRQLWAALRENWDPEKLIEVHSGLSELAELAAHEGFPTLADAAFSAEVYLSSYVGTEIPMTTEQRETVDSLLAGLTADHTQQDGTDVESFPPFDQQKVLVVGPSDGPAGEFAGVLRVLGQEPRTLEDGSGVTDALQDALPALVVADITTIPDLEPAIEKLAHIHKATGQRIPIAYVAPSGDMDTRLRAVRAGGEAFFCPPFDAGETGRKLNALKTLATPHGHRVLVVEDDPSQAEFAASIIRKSGIKTAVVTNPLDVLDKLREFQPDLILMDIYMPEVNGIELTRVIREYNSFADIPIVFLSGEQDTDRQVDALSVGGDDFITKPIRPRQLIAIVENRIRRCQLLRQVDLSASSRKLLTRNQFVDRITNLLSTDPMHVQASAVLLLSPDQGQALQQQLGTDGYEQLLIELAQVVEQELEEKDAIAQVDDGVLGVVVRRHDTNAVHDLGSRLHEAIGSHSFATDNGNYSITTGIGLSLANRGDGDANTLLHRAQLALDQALKAAPAHTVVHEETAESPEVKTEAAPPGEPSTGIAESLKTCIEEDGFVVLYQPMLDLQVRGSEAYAVLLRLPGPKGKLLPLSEFRKEAEKLKLAGAVDQWVLNHVMDAMKQHGTAHSKTLLFVCQSGSSILDPNYPQWIAEQLRAHRMVGTGLVLDFPLSSLSHDLKAAKKHIAALRNMDIKVCLSQFPEKPAAFKLLRYVHGNYIRIAKRLLKTEKETIKAIIDEAHNAKARVVISDIDDPRAIDLHWSSGADLLQGDFIQPPMDGLDYDFAQVVI